MNFVWNRRARGLRGSRWAVYQTHVKNRIAMNWPQFRDSVVKYNPALLDDSWVFKPEKTYCLPREMEQSGIKSKQEVVIPDVPYTSQLDNPHTRGRYWASDPDRSDETPDGCWMNELPGGGHYGCEAGNCPGPVEKGCIRPGSCNVTSLFMLLDYLQLRNPPQKYPDGKPVSAWLKKNPFSPTWLYVYMMDFWGKGRQLWDGVHPASACNSIITARGDYMTEVIRQSAAMNRTRMEVFYTTSATFSEYRFAIDAGSPVVMSSKKIHHVILGIGYKTVNGRNWLIAHDPYGRRRSDLKKWQAYNACGDKSSCGKAVRYPFEKLENAYLLYCRTEA